MTPDVGCTLRSLSHHLALLPSLGLVQAHWQFVDYTNYAVRQPGKKRSKTPAEHPRHSFNVLLVPFPYVVHATDFVRAREPEKGVDGYFIVKQGWLRNGNRALSSPEFAKFIGRLVDSAERDVQEVHAIVLPEAAITRRMAVDLAHALARRFPKLEYIICGAIAADENERRNESIVFRLDGQGTVARYNQSKHHRWRLDGSQIRQYQLGSALDPAHIWWEQIDVHDRSIFFGVNKHEAVLAALVCEDLARQHPISPIIASVGPTVVIALLMDGPQLESRWSARYATVLADDPGASVLTLTCLGLIKRSRPPGTMIRQVIGLWKDRETQTTELVLPEGAFGLVLSLANRNDIEQKTLDLRSDGGNVVEYRLAGTRPVLLEDPPKWLERTS